MTTLKKRSFWFSVLGGVFLILLAWSFFPQHKAYQKAYEVEEKGIVPFAGIERPDYDKKALILYDESEIYDGGALYATMLANLMSHFQFSFEIKPAVLYKEGDLEKRDALFYIGFVKDAHLPQALFTDVYKTSKPVIWIENNLHQLQGNADFDFLKRYGFAFMRTTTSWQEKEKIGKELSFYDRFYYKGKILDRNELAGREANAFSVSLAIAKVIDPAIAKVWATVENPDSERKAPYIIQSGNLWFMADLPLAYEMRDRYLILCDILHDMLKVDHPNKLIGLARIEDVSPGTSSSQLEETINFFEKKKVPLSIGVIPFFKDPSAFSSPRPMDLTFDDSPDTLKILKDFQARGGEIIMHGVTHQREDAKDARLRVSGIGYEFWDFERNEPIRDNTADYIRRKILKGKQELLRQGLTPTAFETPHYTSSALGYRIFAQEFDLTMQSVTYTLYDVTRIPVEVEKVKTAIQTQAIQTFPYIVESDVYGQKIIPSSTVTDFSFEDTQDAKKAEKKMHRIIKQAEALTVVRDGCASFYVHAFLLEMMKQRRIKGRKVLKKIINELREMGYEFSSIQAYEESYDKENQK